MDLELAVGDCCARPVLPEEPSVRCPECGATGARVEPVTLKALLGPEGLRRGVPPAPRFCATAHCPVAYFDNAVLVRFEESLLSVLVHAKHSEDGAVPVCYCFGHTPETIRVDAERTGRSHAGEDVTREVKAGHCACEVKNPKGACCLGDVLKVEKRFAAAGAMP